MPSSTRTEGAASAAPAVVIPEGATLAQIDRMEQAAYDAIDQVQDPGAAEELLRQVTIADHAIRIAKVSEEREHRWGGLRLRAERRYGELLGPKVKGRPSSVRASDTRVEGADREAQSQARKVAAVPEDKFEEYIENESKPTRSGLLRQSAPKPKSKAKRKLAKEPPPLSEAVEFLNRLVRQGQDRWGHGPRLTADELEYVPVVLKALPRRARYAGKRLREVGATRNKLGRKSVVDLQYRILQMTATLETSEIADYDLADDDAMFVTDLYDDLVELQFWMDRTLAVTRAYLDDSHELEKIRMLREDHNGRSSHEIATALALADKLESKRNRKLTRTEG